MATEQEQDVKYRMYEHHWEMLKTHGSIRMEYTSNKLSDIDRMIKKIKKAITKEKYMDKNFRKNYPFARLKIRHDIENKCLICQLTYYHSIQDLMEKRDD